MVVRESGSRKRVGVRENGVGVGERAWAERSRVGVKMGVEEREG